MFRGAELIAHFLHKLSSTQVCGLVELGKGPFPDSKMPETMEISEAAKSGNGSLEQVGIKLDGTFQCPHCRQKFVSDKALQLHLKFQCPTAIAKQINPVGD